MKKKTVKPDHICFECLHYEACQSWNIGSLVRTKADNCVNYRASVDVMSDLIDRLYAIEIIRNYIKEPDILDDRKEIEDYNNGLEMAIAILSTMSTVELKRNTETINNNDYISRKEIIRTLDDIGEDYISFYKLLSIIYKIPSRKKARWIKRKNSDCYECSECRAVLKEEDIKAHNFYYCYHCGAEIDVEYPARIN